MLAVLLGQTLRKIADNPHPALINALQLPEIASPALPSPSPPVLNIMRFSFAVLLALALCGLASSVQATDATLDQAIAGGQAAQLAGGACPLLFCCMARRRPKTHGLWFHTDFPAGPQHIADAVRSVLAPKAELVNAAKTTFTTVQSGLNTLQSTLAAAYANAGSQAEAAVAAFEAQYCKPASFTPSEWGGCRSPLLPAGNFSLRHICPWGGHPIPATPFMSISS